MPHRHCITVEIVPMPHKYLHIFVLAYWLKFQTWLYPEEHDYRI